MTNTLDSKIILHNNLSYFSRKYLMFISGFLVDNDTIKSFE